MSGTVRTEVADGVGTIVLDHVERRNALTVAMWEALPGAAAAMTDDDAVRVVVVRGAGEVAFASGADISEFETTRSSAELNRSYDRLVATATGALGAIPKPVVAAVHGFCLGGGLAVALGCDLRVVADDASFAIPAARLGVGYNAPGVRTLVSLVGPSATKRLLFTAARLPAGEALRIGLVDEVVAKSALDEHVRGLAATMADNAPLTQAAVKVAVRELLRPEAERNHVAVDAAITACFDSADFAEGVDAFLGKRRPRFTGR
ncbi:MAG: enoyl-CoA hydratase [Actinomycetota bacterium]